MFLILKWRIISWIIGLTGIVLLILNIAGVIPWLPVWVYAIILAATFPALIPIAVVAVIGWFALLFARRNNGTNEQWSDR